MMAAPNLIAAAIIPQIKNAKICVWGTPPNLEYPNRLAEEYAMLDVLSQGRLEVAFPRRHLRIARRCGASARQGPDQNRDARGADRQEHRPAAGKYCRGEQPDPLEGRAESAFGPNRRFVAPQRYVNNWG